MQEKMIKFIEQSNWIEREYSERALKDAIKAWEWIAKQKGDLKFSQILRVHNYLMKNIYPEIAGKTRECDVWIGGNCKRFISTNLLKSELNNFCKEFNKLACMKGQDSLENLVAENHVMYEGIHPFADGNGRSGRILYALLRKKLGLPIHIIHGWSKDDGDYHPEQLAYYNWFR